MEAEARKRGRGAAVREGAKIHTGEKESTSAPRARVRALRVDVERHYSISV